jgi:hypothetical protein
MKMSIQIAALRRRIKRLEEDWPLFLQRIADYTPRRERLAIRTYELANRIAPSYWNCFRRRIPAETLALALISRVVTTGL